VSGVLDMIFLDHKGSAAQELWQLADVTRNPSRRVARQQLGR